MTLLLACTLSASTVIVAVLTPLITAFSTAALALIIVVFAAAFLARSLLLGLTEKLWRHLAKNFAEVLRVGWHAG